MSAINELKETLEHTQTASFVTTMLRDISATRLQAIRAAFDANHEYFLELHQLMALVQTYNGRYALEHKQTPEAKRIYLALTSNKRFYGTLNTQVIAMLRKTLATDTDADCMVIGQTGRQILDLSALTDRVPTFFSFNTDDPTNAELVDCVTQLSSYTHIYLVHPTFINSFTQQAKITDITHTPDPQEAKEPLSVDYLFEPDIPKMVEFFTTQIRLVLFGRAMLETKLALTGARLMKMQRAREKAEELLKQQRRVIHKEISTVQSMRLLEAFAGFKSKDSLI